ncbi:MAG: peptide deformylase [Alphaproteobacteria bacterium]
MSILKIARMGHPVLSVPAEAVADPTSRAVRKLVEDMIATMIDAGGAGLAATQVHVGLRVVVFHAPAERNDGDEENAEEEDGDDDSAAAPLTVLINPVIELLTEDKVLGWEGCLSVPELTGAVPRFTHIRYRGLNPAGHEIVREARGFHARVVQHECDHLDGILYPQRIEDMSLFGFAEEINRSFAMAEEAQENSGDRDADAAE